MSIKWGGKIYGWKISTHNLFFFYFHPKKKKFFSEITSECLCELIKNVSSAASCLLACQNSYFSSKVCFCLQMREREKNSSIFTSQHKNLFSFSKICWQKNKIFLFCLSWWMCTEQKDFINWFAKVHCHEIVRKKRKETKSLQIKSFWKYSPWPNIMNILFALSHSHECL
jgi:hypothetical protein